MERGSRAESRIARAWRSAMDDFALAFGGRGEPNRPGRPHKDDEASHESPPDEVIDEASEESFPASDPPAWTPTRL